jgi:hypothetical protein
LFGATRNGVSTDKERARLASSGIGPEESRRDGRFPSIRFGCSYSGLRLKAQAVVHGASEFLFAPKVAFSCLDRYVTEQKLNLVKFAAGQMAQSCAGTTEIVRRELLDARTGGGGLHDVPDHLRRHAVAPHATGLVDGAEHASVREACRGSPGVDGRLDPRGDRNGADVAPFAQEVRNHLVVFALLHRLQSEGEHLAAP